MRDRSPVWIGLCDMALAILAVVIVAVNPPKPAEAGVKEKGEYLLTIDWSVDEDADADIWALGPSERPIFYASRDVGCARLDADNRGFMDAYVTLVDGTVTKIESSKETIQLRCIEPGHWEFAANLYAYRSPEAFENGHIGLKVHAEIVGLNPSVHLVFAKDILLDRIGQTINLTGFDLTKDGEITLTDPALEPITETYQRMKAAPSGQPTGEGGYTPGGTP
jgi:hypothetical protein